MPGVYIVSRLPMFGEGIENMLRGKEGVKILGFERNLDKAIEQIVRLRPDIVVFDCKEDEAEINSTIVQILKKGMKLKIIGIDIQTNTFYVHQHEQHEVGELDDLLQEIE